MTSNKIQHIKVINDEEYISDYLGTLLDQYSPDFVIDCSEFGLNLNQKNISVSRSVGFGENRKLTSFGTIVNHYLTWERDLSGIVTGSCLEKYNSVLLIVGERIISKRVGDFYPWFYSTYIKETPWWTCEYFKKYKGVYFVFLKK
jgi:hypothetical protein